MLPERSESNASHCPSGLSLTTSMLSVVDMIGCADETDTGPDRGNGIDQMPTLVAQAEYAIRPSPPAAMPWILRPEVNRWATSSAVVPFTR